MHPFITSIGTGTDFVPAGSISIAADRRRGFIWVVGNGFSSAHYVREHFHKLEQLLKEMRTETPHIRALIDLTQAPVLASDAAEHVKVATTRIHQPTDQVAIVLKSALLAMQVRRVVKSDRREIFSEIEPALAWLDIDLNAVDCSIVR